MCRYRGHVCEELKIESILNNTDEYVITGSENGTVYIYDLISVRDAIIDWHVDKSSSYTGVSRKTY